MSVQPSSPAPPPARPSPVPALPYSADVDEPVAGIALKGVVGVAALVACLGVLHAGTGLWVHFGRAGFNSVGTWPPGTWRSWVGPVLLLVNGAADVLILAGAAAFRARHASARRLLFWGAAGVVAGTVGLFAMELFSNSFRLGPQNNLRSLVVLVIWRVQWMTGPLAVPLLLVLLLTRPEVKRWLADRPPGG